MHLALIGRKACNNNCIKGRDRNRRCCTHLTRQHQRHRQRRLWLPHCPSRCTNRSAAAASPAPHTPSPASATSLRGAMQTSLSPRLWHCRMLAKTGPVSLQGKDCGCSLWRLLMIVRQKSHHLPGAVSVPMMSGCDTTVQEHIRHCLFCRMFQSNPPRRQLQILPALWNARYDHNCRHIRCWHTAAINRSL